MNAKRHAKPNPDITIDGNLLGPCGIYCGYCLARKKGVCLGCRYQADKRHAEGAENWCPLLDCAEKTGVTQCSDCAKFPCKEHYDPEKDCMYGDVYIRYILDDIKPL